MARCLVIAPASQKEKGRSEILYRGDNEKEALKVAEEASRKKEYYVSVEFRGYFSFSDTRDIIGVDCIKFTNGKIFKELRQHFFLDDLAELAEAFADIHKLKM